MQALSRVFSLSLMLESGLMALLTPLVYCHGQHLTIRELVGVTYTKLNGNGEEVTAGLLGNGVATWNTRKVDIAWLNNASLSLGSLQDLLGEAIHLVSRCPGFKRL